MTEGWTKVGLAVAAALALTGPAAAGGQGKIASCFLNDDDNFTDIGKFATTQAAIAAARRFTVEEGKYLVATIGNDYPPRFIAIDSSGRVLKVGEDICVGSGQKMRPPD